MYTRVLCKLKTETRSDNDDASDDEDAGGGDGGARLPCRKPSHS